MGFKTFRAAVVQRLLLFSGFVFVAIWGFVETEWQVTPLLAAALAVLVLIETIRYVESVNRELAGFLEFVAHDDFSSAVATGKTGAVFKKLEAAYRVLADKYRHLNRRRELNHLYLEALVEHVSIAMLCLDDRNRVTLMNREAKRLFRTPLLGSLAALERIDPRLPTQLESLADGDHTLIQLRIAGEPVQLASYVTEFQLLDERHRLISFQNIRDELEQREIDYSQKLIKVLTHEIMNSVTPIISLTKLIADRLVDEKSGELAVQGLAGEERRDLARGLTSIHSRGSGLLKFVQAYSALTNLPRPSFVEVDVTALLDRVQTLLAPALEAEGVSLQVQAVGGDLAVRADPQQIEQVLINLVKNACEALAESHEGRVVLRGARDDQGKVLIQVTDNGPGIDSAHLDDIFLPFFTTKRNGSGVGLSVSRQIMALNKGLLTVKTAPGGGSEFTLRFR
jgi:two-component system, NtrC family, nitrogen regulation sensor histidine kinase NtrY